jgi:MFS family permease
MRQGRLAGRYPAVAAMVVFSLVPYLVLSAAFQPLQPIIAGDLGMSAQALSLAGGIANAAYALGTIVSVQLALLLPQRRLLLVYGMLLVIGSVLAAAATAPPVFVTGHVLQGLCTSMLLIAAVPPLVIGYPESRLRPTTLILNLGIFGAVALGPFIGGLQADAGNWRPLFWIIAGIAILAVVLSVLTFEDAPPAAAESPDAPGAGDAAGPPKDPLALGLAAAGCLLAFYGASELLTHEFVGARTPNGRCSPFAASCGARSRWPGSWRRSAQRPAPWVRPVSPPRRSSIGIPRYTSGCSICRSSPAR